MVRFCGFETVAVLKPNRIVGNGLVLVLVLAFENRTETETAPQIRCHVLISYLLESIHLVCTCHNNDYLFSNLYPSSSLASQCFFTGKDENFITSKSTSEP